MSEKKMDWKDTLNLPRTDFPMKAQLSQKEPETLKKWQEADIYETNPEEPRPAALRTSCTTARPTPTATSTWARP